MSRLRVQSFAISIDGYGAGPNQDLQNPLGVRGPELMEWFVHTRLLRKMHGNDGGENLLQGIDLHALGYECAQSVAGERATHVFLRKRG